MYREWPSTYSVLKQAGYRTGMIGKLHVNPESSIEKWIDFRAIKSSNFAKNNLVRYSQNAARFFRESEDPFFLTVNFPDAHWPVQNQVENRPAQLLQARDVRPMGYVAFDNPRMRNHIRGYYNCLSRLDECVGELLKALEESGKSDNTLVIYLGDHGAQFSRGKVFLYEGGLRVPMIVRWPGVAKKGFVSKQLVSTIDLFPTIVSAAGAPVPRHVPGVNLDNVLQGETKPVRSYLFAERNTDAAIFHFPQRAVRNSRYKLIKTLLHGQRDPAVHRYLVNGASNFRGSPTYEELKKADEPVKAIYQSWLKPAEYQLFDLQTDPSELHNLAGKAEYRDVETELKKRLASWQEESGDWMREPNRLKQLTAEVNECLKNETRIPKGGWKYANYLKPEIQVAPISNEPKK